MTDRDEKLAKWFEEQSIGPASAVAVCICGDDVAVRYNVFCADCMRLVAAALRGSEAKDKAFRKLYTVMEHLENRVITDDQGVRIPYSEACYCSGVEREPAADFDLQCLPCKMQEALAAARPFIEGGKP